MEKSYASFRTGANTYSSLNSGWMGNVYSDFGVANTNVSLNTTDSQLFSLLSNALNNKKPVTFATFSSGTTLVSDHAYTHPDERPPEHRRDHRATPRNPGLQRRFARRRKRPRPR